MAQGQPCANRQIGTAGAGVDHIHFVAHGEYGIRLPEDPTGVCNEIWEKLGIKCMIVDANDLTRDILGKCDAITLSDEALCDIIRDNPAGQSKQLTPFILIREKQ